MIAFDRKLVVFQAKREAAHASLNIFEGSANSVSCSVHQFEKGVWAAAVAVAVLLSAGLGGCGDESDSNQARVVAGSDAAYRAKWLEVSSSLTPAQWLVSRRDDRLAQLNDADVKTVAQRLAEANARYRESERMIANRAMQVSDMLVPLGITESPIAILDDLTSIAGEVGQTEGFGAVSQHYFNLRVAQVERGEALAVLKARYGPRR